MFVVFLAAFEFMGMTSPKAALDCKVKVAMSARFHLIMRFDSLLSLSRWGDMIAVTKERGMSYMVMVDLGTLRPPCRALDFIAAWSFAPIRFRSCSSWRCSNARLQSMDCLHKGNSIGIRVVTWVSTKDANKPQLFIK